MKTKLPTDMPAAAKPARSLINALDQNEHAKDLVTEAAEELSSVNADLKQQLSAGEAQPAVENALEKSVAVEDKVQQASAKLEVVNLALKDEVKVRHVLENQLAAVTEQGAVDRQILEEQLAMATEQGEADHHAAFHDALTGLPNRALFNDRLQHGIAQAARHGWSLAVMFIDLDDFKIINDTHGHDVGDRVLCTIATRLKDNTRSDDTVSRFGGDEFLYLLMEVGDQKSVIALAEKIIKSIRTPCDVAVTGLPDGVTVKASVGIAVYPKNGATAEALIKSADTAMFEAKRAKAGYAFAQ
jgi:diguanylate cyclase (GGDEF)-like protein